MHRRDELDILDRAIDALVEPGDPYRLVGRFLRRVARLFEADAALLFARPRAIEPILGSLSLSASDAKALAEEARSRVRAQDGSSTTWAPPGSADWPALLAARIPSEPEEGVLALLAKQPDRFDADRHGPILAALGRHAAVAIDRAVRHGEARRQADEAEIHAEASRYVRDALERHSRDIEGSLATRSRFFAAMSHELRTPVNAILGYNQLLRQGVYGELPRRHADIVGKITSSAEQLLTLVDDILDLAKIEAGRIEARREPVDIRTLVREAVSTVEIQTLGKQLELQVDCSGSVPALQTDGVRVRQILLNLLSNAVKFTPEGSVNIRVRHIGDTELLPPARRPSCSPGDQGWISVVVQDTGIGIPREKLDAIFDEFVQVVGDDPGRGTGLGLAICSRLAHLLGGDLTVESEVGVHSTFTLFLPCPTCTFEPLANPP